MSNTLSKLSAKWSRNKAIKQAQADTQLAFYRNRQAELDASPDIPEGVKQKAEAEMRQYITDTYPTLFT